MALAASGGVLSGIIYDKVTSNPDPIMLVNNPTGFNFIKIVKVIAILTVGAFAIRLIVKMFGIKIFNKFTR
jgi:hypothetical protein